MSLLGQGQGYVGVLTSADLAGFGDSYIAEGDQVFVLDRMNAFAYRLTFDPPDGFDIIKAVNLPGAWVNTVKPATNVGPTFVSLQAPGSTNSVAFVDLLSTDVLSTGNDSFLVSASVCCSASAGLVSNAAFQLTLDGSALNNVNWRVAFNDVGGSVVGSSQVALSAIPAGTRTIAIQWRVDDASGVTISVTPAVNEHASMLITRLTGV